MRLKPNRTKKGVENLQVVVLGFCTPIPCLLNKEVQGVEPK